MVCDLIDRQAALDCFHDWIDKHGDVHTADEMTEYRAIEALPSAQPEQKKGEWILSDLQDENEVANDNFYYVCSCCGASDLHAKSMKVPFCWKCGARMRGEEDADKE